MVSAITLKKLRNDQNAKKLIATLHMKTMPSFSSLLLSIRGLRCLHKREEQQANLRQNIFLNLFRNRFLVNTIRVRSFVTFLKCCVRNFDTAQVKQRPHRLVQQ